MSFTNKWHQPQYKMQRLHLKRRGITVKQAIERGYEPLTGTEVRREIGQDAGPCIAITIYRKDGKPREDRRYRLVDKAKVKARGQRYTQASGTGTLIHVRHPRTPNLEFKDRVVITEGEFKADQIAEALGVTAISVPGVRAFRKGDKLHPALRAFDWPNLTAEFAYDSDQDVKPQVRGPMLDAADLLAAAGATVQIREVQNLSNEEKAGADDVIQAHGAAGYLMAPLHDLDSAPVKKWRELLGKEGTNPRLPASLRGLQPVDATWLEATPPPIEYIVPPYLQANENALVAGEAGTSKSMWLIYMTAAIATGTPFFGHPVESCLPVLYVMLERHSNSFQRRFHKVAHHIADGLPPGPRKKFLRDLSINSYAKPLAGETLNLIEFKNNQWAPSSVVEELIAELNAAGIRVLILDPLSRLHGGNENAAEVAAAITRALERIMQQTGCSILLVHHTGKNASGGKYAGRGSSAFTDNTSETISLEQLSSDARLKLETSALRDDELNDDIIRVEHARCSDGAPADDMYLVRARKTGLLRRVFLSRKSAADAVQELTGNNQKLVKWAEGRQFSKHQFVTDRNKIFPGKISERDAEAVFNSAVASQTLREAGKRRSGKIFEYAPGKPSSAEAEVGSCAVVARATAQHKKSGGAHGR